MGRAPFDATEEKALIAASKEGDLEAFNRLVLAYQGLVYNVAYRILGDSEAAADATQEAFLSAFQAIGKFRGGSFRAWLLRIVSNACYDQLRHRKRRPTTSLDAMPINPEHISILADDGLSPEEYAIRQELNRAIQAGLQTLPPEQRLVLVLSDIEGLSYKEIAAATGVSLGTVKSRLSRGRAKLRDYLLSQEELLPARYRLQK